MDADSRQGRTLAARFRAHVVNPVVRGLLRSPAHRVLSGSVLLLAYTGRRSGVRRELPAIYAARDGRFVVIAGQPDTKTWWRNFADDVRPVTVTVAGRRHDCAAQLLEPGTAEHQLALHTYRQRYPRVPVVDGTPVLVLTPVPAGSAGPQTLVTRGETDVPIAGGQPAGARGAPRVAPGSFVPGPKSSPTGSAAPT
jgi:hypothetical protein